MVNDTRNRPSRWASHHIRVKAKQLLSVLRPDITPGMKYAVVTVRGAMLWGVYLYGVIGFYTINLALTATAEDRIPFPVPAHRWCAIDWS